MEEKDYIYVYNDKGIKQKMELVLSFERNGKRFIVYKELNKKVPLYMAKVKLEEGVTALDTNLNVIEQEMVTEIIRDYFLGGTDDV